MTHTVKETVVVQIGVQIFIKYMKIKKYYGQN